MSASTCADMAFALLQRVLARLRDESLVPAQIIGFHWGGKESLGCTEPTPRADTIFFCTSGFFVHKRMGEALGMLCVRLENN